MSDGPVRVESISLYPIKSLDPVPVSDSRVLSSGALEHDREFALFDPQGNWINGKRDARIHRIRAEYDLERFLVRLSSEGRGTERFHLLDNRVQIEDWFSDVLRTTVSLERNTTTGFPDDLESPGPTIVGTGTLREVGSWFTIADEKKTRRRFRANIVISSETPFWEDRLFGAADTTMRFQIGDVTVLGVNPCQRCAVPSRDPQTGEVMPDFQRLFSQQRERHLPAWATRSRFNHYYRLAVNTRIPASEEGKVIQIGDSVSL